MRLIVPVIVVLVSVTLSDDSAQVSPDLGEMLSERVTVPVNPF